MDDTHDYIKLISDFTKLQEDVQYSQLSKLEQSREQVLICIKAILETNLRVRSLVRKVQALGGPKLAQLLPPIVIMQNEFEAAAIKFFSQDCVDFAKAENIKAICFEPSKATSSSDITDQKHNAMIATELHMLPMDFVQTYSGDEEIVWQEASSNFDMQTLLKSSRARGIAYSAALNSLQYEGRVIIYCQPFEAERILKEFYKINKTSPRTIILTEPESITTNHSTLRKYQEKYKHTITALEKIALIETLNYSHKDALFDLILKK
jgi:hypothetical protein